MNIDHIFVSVIMPVYNAAPYLPESISSILAQTHTNFEFIIVDDCSEDQSVAVIKEFQDPRIWLIEKKTNTGISDTLNQGLAKAQGKYIIRMDADDISIEHRFVTQITFMEKNVQVGVAGSFMQKFQVIDGNTQQLADHSFPIDNNHCRFNLFTHQGYNYHPTVIIRHALLQKYNLAYDSSTEPSEDSNLWHRLMPYCQFYNIPEKLVHYRVHPQQISTITENQLIPSHKDTLKQCIQSFMQELTEEEFNLHYNFFHSQMTMRSLKQLRKTQRWLKKLLAANQKSEWICEQNYLRERIESSWFTFCNDHTHFGLNTWFIYLRSGLNKHYSVGKKNQVIFFIDCLFALRSNYLGKR